MKTNMLKKEAIINNSHASTLALVDKFIDWHFQLKSKLDKGPAKEDGKAHFLEKDFPMYLEQYFSQIEQLGQQTANYDKQEQKKLFNYIKQSGLHKLLENAPFYHHAIFKPRGYAGDAESMSIVYRNEFEGQDHFSQLMNKIATSADVCTAIRNRKDLLKQAILDLKNGQIMSLAAGPAQEIQEALLSKTTNQFLALDHDIETLKSVHIKKPDFEYGLLNAFHLIKGNHRYLIPRKNRLHLCHPKTDTVGLNKITIPIKYKIRKLQASSFDLIYSAGLFDYIKTHKNPQKGTVQLTKILFDLLKPNGRLLIGNISQKQSIGVKWALECKCDWHLIYRTKAEVLQFASAIPPTKIQSMNVIAEPTAINWFLDIRKK